MTFRDLVRRHFEYTFEKEAWQPPLAAAVEGLSARQAAWKPGPRRHSIWQIVRHLLLWKQATLEAWEGKAQDWDALERVDWQEVEGNEEDWSSDVRALHDVQGRIMARLDETSDDAMLRPFPGEKELSSAERLVRFATHDIYHAGQIRYVRALQGA